MAAGEFDLIRRHFAELTPVRPDIPLAVGDDAALLRASGDQAWAWSIDTLVEGVHFAAGDDAASLGHKALAVNLSDLAAVGAQPVAALLSLTLPQADDAWCAAFASGFGDLARRHGVSLVGGDTTHGPRSVSVSVLGRVPEAQALRRDTARAGDLVAVTGPLGDAALALQLGDRAPAALALALHRPEPQVAVGVALRGQAHAAIDVSDGLMADLGHLCEASGVGARVRVDCLPQSPAFAAVAPADAVALQAAGGDDYVLCVSIAPDRFDDAQAALQEIGATLYVVGRIIAGAGVLLCTADGAPVPLPRTGYVHFVGDHGHG
jgi:thiamine-monophosphate kinase